MPSEQPAKLDLKSMSITADQKAKLKQLFPEVFNEDNIDFDKLKRTLGQEIDSGEERFGMTWPGKNDCFKVIQTPSIGTLKPAKEESVNWDITENLFIEGDNLEVLKLLQSVYYGKVKMIYIDPPYNTGKEFIYPDNYTESLETYLTYTGQKDEEGQKFTTNAETSGRFHSKWLNMMYPRLFLAKNLLCEDGAIFVSIDDNEVHNLRMLMNEIFGEENFIAEFIIKSNPRGSQSTRNSAIVHDYLLCFCRNAEEMSQLQQELTAEMKEEYSAVYTDGRQYRLLGLRLRGGAWRRQDRPLLFYPIYVNPKNGEIALSKTEEYPITVLPIQPTTGQEGTWRWNKKKVEQNINLLVAKQVTRNDVLDWDIFQYDFLETSKGEERKTKPKTIWDEKDVNYERGTEEVKQLFDNKGIFSFPKPIGLLKRILKTAYIETNDIVLDFFAGSCTMANAVMCLNAEDGKNRKFICVQLPEPCAEDSEAFMAEYKTIAEIGKERIRRGIKKIQEEQTAKEKHSEGQLPGMGEEKEEIDLGFKVFKLDSSNFNLWDGTVDEKGDVSSQIELFIDHIDPNAKDDDILYEILLKTRFPLTTKIDPLQLAGKTVYSVADKALLICLDRKLTKEVIAEMARLQPARVVCLDAGFADNDQLKTNAVQIMKSHNVEDFRTV